MMPKAVFFSIPAHGHINPTLPLVAELVRSGDEVVYYSTVTFKARIEGTGAQFKEYRNSAHFDTTKPGKSLGFFYYTLSKVAYGLLDELIADRPSSVLTT
jgi:UDP:flavonoid glycosyltransferase YjiC (YdhE family)